MKRFLRPACVLGSIAGLGLFGACDWSGQSALTSAGSGGAGSVTSVGGAGPGTGGDRGTGGGGGGIGGAGGEAPGVHITGLTGPVQALYDPNGVLHVACAEDDDCFATLGYLHSQNRFFFMDFIRNLVRGSLGSLVKAGNTVLSKDYENRLFFTTRQGEPLEDALYTQASPEVRGHLDAYARGVNAWIADMRAGKNGATLTDEYNYPLIVPSAIRDWEPQDSAAVGLYVLNDLSNDSADEIANGAEIPVFEPSIVADVFSPAPVFDAFTVVAGNTPRPPPPPSQLAPSVSKRLAPFAALLAQAGASAGHLAGMPASRRSGDRGSNNWVVGPSHSTTGNALLANDPHLLLSNPSIWFPVEVDAKSNGGHGTYHMEGGSFPGLPCVFVGHNESIGWGVTTAYWDLADVYLEQLSTDNKSVRFNGADVALVEKSFSFTDVSTGMTTMKTFQWVPHHGPLVSVDTAAHTGVSIRWRGHDGGTDLDAFFAVGRSKTVDEAKAGLARYATSANQNFVFVDGSGNIGWFPYSQVPTRTWASAALPPWLPLPGDGTAEWGPPVAMADLPQLSNPAAGYIATANNDMTGASEDGDPTNDGQAAIQSWSKADGTRAQRILDLLAAGGDAHTIDTMHVIQGDTYSLYASVVVPEVLRVAGAASGLTADEQNVVTGLTGWQYTCPTGLDGDDPVAAGKDAATAAESIGCTAFHTVLFALGDAAIGDEAAAAGIKDTSGFGLEFVVRALKNPSSVASGDLFWDDVSTAAVVETKDDILLKALSDASVVLKTFGAPDEWRWGRRHTLSLRSIFDNFGITKYNYAAQAAVGGLYTVDVANPNTRTLLTTPEGDFSFTNGPSIRIQVEAVAGGTPKMRFELPGGADLHHASPFYNNLLPGWLANEPVDFPFGPGAVPNPAVTIVVTPP